MKKIFDKVNGRKPEEQERVALERSQNLAASSTYYNKNEKIVSKIKMFLFS